MNVLCRLIQIFARGRSLFQRSPTDCGVSEYYLDTSTMRRPRLKSADEWYVRTGKNKIKNSEVRHPRCVLNYRKG